MSAPAGYRVPARGAEATLTDRGSRFLAVVRPAADEAEARAVLEALTASHRDATHLCWAWRLGPEGRERSSDAGEPAGTAGEPMRRVLAGAGLSDVVAVVVRWYGGTKLGKGGLARAYAGAVKAAIEELPVARRVPTVEVEVEVPLARAGAVKRLLRPPEVALVGERYGERARLVLAVAAPRLPSVEERLSALGGTFRRIG